jgi:hypothetical protein
MVKEDDEQKLILNDDVKIKVNHLKFNFHHYFAAFIAYDRFNSIARPLDGKMSTTKGFVMVLFVWFYA